VSTVAWDGKTIAADRGGVTYERMHLLDKLFVLDDGTIAACTGVYEIGQLMLQWYVDGKKPEQFPKAAQDPDNSTTLIVIPDGHGQAYQITSQPVLVPVECPMAWGSGGDIALGAMHAGANADKAVQIAGKLDIYTHPENVVHSVVK